MFFIVHSLLSRKRACEEEILFLMDQLRRGERITLEYFDELLVYMWKDIHNYINSPEKFVALTLDYIYESMQYIHSFYELFKQYI